MIVGRRVQCTTCGQTKAPVGRSVPAGMYPCNHECDGYYESPEPGWLFPREVWRESFPNNPEPEPAECYKEVMGGMEEQPDGTIHFEELDK